MRDKQGDVLVSFAVEGLSQELHVLGFAGEEALSELFRFELDLACEARDLDFDKVVGEPGVLTISSDGNDRYVHGMISHLEQHESARRFTVYRATLTARAWRLNHRHDCRIFQDKTAKEIITEVLDHDSVEFRFRCKGGREPDRREYCVQHRESDWNFVCRLLEEEGYFYFFEHEEDKHELVISNDPQVHKAITGDSNVLFHGRDHKTPKEEHVFSFVYREQVISGAVALRDYNHELPSLDYQVDEAGPEDQKLERYDYPGLYDMPEKGAVVGSMRLEEHQAQRRGGSGGGTCTRFTPGSTFTMEQHPRASINMEYLVTGVQHTAEKHGNLESGAVSNRCRYHNTFGCMDASLPFRPPRITRRPFVLGPQTAVVVGPFGEEIYTDKLGRVKVQFHWDRLGASDHHSSCWVRVSQLWAGQGYGAMYIPRIGHEVIVDFVEGEPDRPVIMGRVYHAQNVPPLDLPKDATRSTIKSNSSPGGGGSNEIRFEDNKGAEEIYTHAEKDQNEVVESNHSTYVGNDQTRTVHANRKATVETGDDTIYVEEGSRFTQVKKEAALAVLENDRTVVVVEGNYDLDAKSRVKVLGRAGISQIGLQKGVVIQGTGDGVSIVGTGEGVSIVGTGKQVEIKAEGDSGHMNVFATKSVSINVGGASGPTITVTPTQVKVDGNGNEVQILGSKIKLNT